MPFGCSQQRRGDLFFTKNQYEKRTSQLRDQFADLVFAFCGRALYLELQHALPFSKDTVPPNNFRLSLPEDHGVHWLE